MKDIQFGEVVGPDFKPVTIEDESAYWIFVDKRTVDTAFRLEYGSIEVVVL